MSNSIVIVGGGHCAGQAADALVRSGHGDGLVLIGCEDHPPYQRPPLSKKLLAGEIEPQRTYLKPRRYYQEHGVDLRLGRRVLAVERDNGSIVLDDNTRIAYGRLLLATGSRPRALELPGRELDHIFDLRTLDDTARIRSRLERGARLVVIGGGFIGLEVASVARGLGLEVTVLEAAPRLLARVMPEPMSRFYERVHRSRGVDVRLGVRVLGFEGGPEVRAVQCDSGAVPCDLVVIGIGVVPNDALAKASGLACEDGVLVDARCATDDPAIFAAGDCARQYHPRFERRIRLESVGNAVAQARTAAANLTGGSETCDELPWFWSDQFDVKLQMAGLSSDHQLAVTRGSEERECFIRFYLTDGVVSAVDAVNSPREFMACRKLVEAGARLAPERLADAETPLRDLL